MSPDRPYRCQSDCSRPEVGGYAPRSPASRHHLQAGYRYKRGQSPRSRYPQRRYSPHSARRIRSNHHYPHRSYEQVRRAHGSRSSHRRRMYQGGYDGYQKEYYAQPPPPPPPATPPPAPTPSPSDPYQCYSTSRIPSANFPQNDKLCSTHPSNTQFKVVLDVRQFNPEDLTVKTCGKHALIQAVRTEDKGRKGVVVKEFTRRYLLPDGSDTSRVSCILTEDGYLTVEVPLKGLQSTEPERIVPITMVSSRSVMDYDDDRQYRQQNNQGRPSSGRASPTRY